MPTKISKSPGSAPPSPDTLSSFHRQTPALHVLHVASMVKTAFVQPINIINILVQQTAIYPSTRSKIVINSRSMLLHSLRKLTRRNRTD